MERAERKEAAGAAALPGGGVVSGRVREGRFLLSFGISWGAYAAIVASTPSSSKTAPGGGRKFAAWTFALAGLGALAFSGYNGWQRYQRENPPPLPEVIAPIPPGQQEALRTGMKLLSKTVLQATPEQEKRLAEMWDKTPRSLAEIIERQRETDRILTPEQRAKLAPLRRAFQNRIVDEMLEPARDRFAAEDFEKFREEVKKRVEERITGP